MKHSNQRVRDKNKFRDTLNNNNITLKMLKVIYSKTPPSTLENLWYRQAHAPSVYYDVLELYSKHYQKDWVI